MILLLYVARSLFYSNVKTTRRRRRQEMFHLRCRDAPKKKRWRRKCYLHIPCISKKKREKKESEFFFFGKSLFHPWLMRQVGGGGLFAPLAKIIYPTHSLVGFW